MNTLNQWASALACITVLCFGAHSAFANPMNAAGIDKGHSYQLAYYNIKTGEKRYPQKTATAEPATVETMTRNSSCFHIQSLSKPISVYKNRFCAKPENSLAERANQDDSKRYF